MKTNITKDPKVFESYANKCLAEGQEGKMIHTADKPCVWVGLDESTYDRRECEKRGLEIGKGAYYAGAIVNAPGDVTFCLVTWGYTPIASQMYDTFAKDLSSRGLDVVQDNNDIIGNNKKLYSYVSVMQPSGYCITFGHFSVGEPDMEAIKAICTKPMGKVPGSLAEYGISTDEITSFVERIINKGA